MKIKRDPIEQTKEFKAIEAELEVKIKQMIGEESGYMGYCHRYWSAKRIILKRDYGIDWQSPAMLNPMIHFD